MGLQNIDDDDDDDDDSEIYRHESDGDIREFFLVGVTAGWRPRYGDSENNDKLLGFWAFFHCLIHQKWGMEWGKIRKITVALFQEPMYWRHLPYIYIYIHICPMCYMSRIFQQIYTIDPNFYGYIDNINNIHIYI